MTISAELAAIYTSAPVDRHYIETLSLEHPGFPVGVRYLTNERDGWTGTLEDGSTIVPFEYVPFTVIPPRSAAEGHIQLQVAIDNVSRELIDNLETLSETPTEPIVLTYRVYHSDDTTVVQNDPPMVLDIQSVTATNHLVSFNAGLTNIRDRPFPSVLYTVEQFPGLNR